MNDKSLFNKAKETYRYAEKIYDELCDDPAYLIQAGFWLHQTVELVMRFLFDKADAGLPETHDLDQLIRIAEERDIDLYPTQYVSEHIEMLTLWAERKDLPDYQPERWKVERAMEGVRKYLDFIEKNIDILNPSSLTNVEKSMGKPALSDDFSVEDIHRLREFIYEQTRGFTAEQFREYYRPAVERFMAEMEEKRARQTTTKRNDENT